MECVSLKRLLEGKDIFKKGDRVVFIDKEREGEWGFPKYGATGTIERVDGDGFPAVRWDKKTPCGLRVSHILQERLEKYVEPQKVVIWRDPHDMLRVVAKDMLTGETAEARCHPEEQDSFNFEFGAHLALGRLYGHEPEIVEVGIEIDPDDIPVHPIPDVSLPITEEKPEPKFKVGDKIRLKDPERFDTAWAYECAGRGELTVKAVDDCGGLYVEEVPYSFCPEWVEKVEPAEEPNACKFKVGDKIIGNKNANRYGVTREGWIGTVTELLDEPGEGGGCDKGRIVNFVAEGEDGAPYWLSDDAFDLYEEPEEETVIHCNLEENARIIAMIMDFDAEGKVFDWYEQHIQQILSRSEAPSKEPKYYTGKLVCVYSGVRWWTVGKVYPVTEGVVRDNDGDERVGVNSLDDLHHKVANYAKFIELKE